MIKASLSLLLIILLAACSQALGTAPTITRRADSPTSTTGPSGSITDTPAGLVGPTPAAALDLMSGSADLRDSSALIWLSGDRIAVAVAAGVALIGIPTLGPAPQAAQRLAIANGESPTFLTTSPTKTNVAWVSGGNTVAYWDTSIAEQAKIIVSSENPITGLAINPQGNLAAYATTQGDLVQVDLSNQTVAWDWQVPGWLVNLSYSPDNQSLAGIDLANFTATIYSQDGQVEKQLAWSGTASSSLYGGFFSPDWTLIAWVAQGAVQLMDVSSGQEGSLLNHQDAVSSVVWSPDSKIIATSAAMFNDGNLEPVVYLWSPNLDTPISTLPQKAAVQSISFSPDGQSLAVLDVSGSVQIFNLSR